MNFCHHLWFCVALMASTTACVDDGALATVAAAGGTAVTGAVNSLDATFVSDGIDFDGDDCTPGPTYDGDIEETAGAGAVTGFGATKCDADGCCVVYGAEALGSKVGVV